MSAKIMIVEDERIVAMDLEERLTELGYAVVGIADSGEKAVSLDNETSPDLILMDIMVHGDVDGIQTAATIRKRRDVPIIFVTAYSDDSTLSRAKLEEPFGYILKPFDNKDLRSAIEVGLHKHAAEAKVKQLGRWLSTTLRSLGDGIISTDLDGIVNFLNPAAETITGWSNREACGLSHTQVFSLIDDKARQPVESPITRAVKEGVIVHLGDGYLLCAKDGRYVPIDDSAAPIHADSGVVTGYVVIFRDISERKSAEEDKRRMEEQLRQSQKLETIGRLAGGVAHDFNNLMTVVLGQTQLLQHKTQDSSILRGLQAIGSAGEKAAAVTRQLLAFSRKQVLRSIALDLNSTISKMDLVLQRLIGEDIIVVNALQPGLPKIQADATQVEQIILNLAINARDAMAHGGKLTIETKTETLDENYAATHIGTRPGPYVMLAMSDNGCGMDAATKAQIFEPFFTTKPIGKGTGLGLARIMHQNQRAWLAVC